jgi:hypothetical protein
MSATDHWLAVAQFTPPKFSLNTQLNFILTSTLGCPSLGASIHIPIWHLDALLVFGIPRATCPDNHIFLHFSVTTVLGERTNYKVPYHLNNLFFTRFNTPHVWCHFLFRILSPSINKAESPYS